MEYLQLFSFAWGLCSPLLPPTGSPRMGLATWPASWYLNWGVTAGPFLLVRIPLAVCLCHDSSVLPELLLN